MAALRGRVPSNCVPDAVQHFVLRRVRSTNDTQRS